MYLCALPYQLSFAKVKLGGSKEQTSGLKKQSREQTSGLKKQSREQTNGLKKQSRILFSIFPRTCGPSMGNW